MPPLLFETVGQDVERKRRDAVLKGFEVEVGTEAHDLLVGRYETVDAVADLHSEITPGRLVENQRSKFLAHIRFTETAAFGNGNPHNFQKIPLYGITLESDLTVLEVAAPAHTSHGDQLARSARNVGYLRIGHQFLTQGTVTYSGTGGDPHGDKAVFVETHVVVHHIVVLETYEAGGDDQSDRDKELHAEQQRTQAAAAAGSAERSLDHQSGSERGDVPRRIETGGERHD